MSQIIETVIPTLGVVFFALLNISPLKRIYKITQTKNSDNYNIFPLIGLLLSSIAWFFYGLYLENFIFIIMNACSIGIIIHNILTITFYSSQDKEFDNKIVRLTLGFIIPLQFLLFTLSYIIFTDNTKNILGINLSIVGSIYRFSHLSKIYNIIKNKNSVLIDTNFTICALCNSCIWLVYYMILDDIFLTIWGCVGIIIYICLIICKILFYKYEEQIIENEENPETEVNEDIP